MSKISPTSRKSPSLSNQSNEPNQPDVPNAPGSLNAPPGTPNAVPVDQHPLSPAPVNPKIEFPEGHQGGPQPLCTIAGTAPNNKPSPLLISHASANAPSSPTNLTSVNLNSPPPNVQQDLDGTSSEADDDADPQTLSERTPLSPSSSSTAHSGQSAARLGKGDVFNAALVRGGLDGLYTAVGKLGGEVAAGLLLTNKVESTAALWILRLFPPVMGATLGVALGSRLGTYVGEKLGISSTAQYSPSKIGGVTGGVVMLGIGALTPISYGLRLSQTVQIASLTRNIVYPIIRDLLTQATRECGPRVEPPTDSARRFKMTLAAALIYGVWSVGGAASNAALGNPSTQTLSQYLLDALPHVGVSAGVEFLDTVSGIASRAFQTARQPDVLAPPVEQQMPGAFEPELALEMPDAPELTVASAPPPDHYYQEPGVFRPHEHFLQAPDPVATWIAAHARIVGVNAVQIVPAPANFEQFYLNLLQCVLNASTEFRGISANQATEYLKDVVSWFKGSQDSVNQSDIPMQNLSTGPVQPIVPARPGNSASQANSGDLTQITEDEYNNLMSDIHVPAT